MQGQQATSGSDLHSRSGSEHSPTLLYLRERKVQNSFKRDHAEDSDGDRPNFCFNLKNETYTVMRSYLNSYGQQAKLYYTKFTPNHKQKKMGQVCIIHGYGENTDDYLRMADFLAKRGNVVHMLDLRGYGYSGGSRVNEPTFHLFYDIETLLRNCCERNLSTFIIAHGLGALFTNFFLQQNPTLPISGVIFISPLLSFGKFNKYTTLQKILHWVFPSLFGNLLVHNMINPTASAKNPHAIKNRIDSVFFQSFLTLNMATEYQEIGKKAQAEAYKFVYPVLICYGKKDLIQDPREVEKLFKKISSIDKEVEAFPEGYHQLHKDDQSDEMFIKMVRWMEKRQGEVKWKTIPQLNKRNYLRWSLIWGKLGIAIGILILILQLARKLKCLQGFIH